MKRDQGQGRGCGEAEGAAWYDDSSRVCKAMRARQEVCKAMRASGKVMIDVETTESSEQPIEPNRPYGVQVSNRTGNGSGVWSTHEA